MTGASSEAVVSAAAAVTTGARIRAAAFEAA